jgi:DNA-binding PadR family transcriptional regulator
MGDLREGLFFGDFVRLHVLHRAAQRPITCTDIMAGLRRNGYRLGPQRLASALQRLERAGYLSSSSVSHAGNPRTYYEATPKGCHVLEIAKVRIQELASKVLSQPSDL